MGLVVAVQFVTTMAGIASPLAYGIAFLIVMMLGVCLAQLALHLPSAGGYYTYVCRSLNSKAGFLTGWMFFIYDPLTAAVNLAYLGFIVQTTLRMEAHINLPWYVAACWTAGAVDGAPGLEHAASASRRGGAEPGRGCRDSFFHVI
jgi:amino acid transporter